MDDGSRLFAYRLTTRPTEGVIDLGVKGLPNLSENSRVVDTSLTNTGLIRFAGAVDLGASGLVGLF